MDTSHLLALLTALRQGLAQLRDAEPAERERIFDECAAPLIELERIAMGLADEAADLAQVRVLARGLNDNLRGQL